MTQRSPDRAAGAIARRPTWFLRSAWPWRSLAYLVSGVALGAATVAVFPLLRDRRRGRWRSCWSGCWRSRRWCWLSIYVARFERWRLRLVEPDCRPPTRTGRCRSRTWRERWHWVLVRLREPATWREFGYAIVSCLALWWIDLADRRASPSTCRRCSSARRPTSPATRPVPRGPDGAVRGRADPGGGRLPGDRVGGGPGRDDPGDPACRSTRELGEAVRSRARLVDAFEVERRRIERDLHDGAQQRLVALSLKLGTGPAGPAARVAGGRPGRRGARAGQAGPRRAARADPRRPPAGAHRPRPARRRRGPGRPRAGAGRRRHARCPAGCPRPVELAAYFVVAEALTNVARHSGATPGRRQRAASTGDRSRAGDHATTAGAAPIPAGGTGLAGLADRVAAVDGTADALQPGRRARR